MENRQIKFRFWGKFGELNEEKDECEIEMLYGDRFCFSDHAPIKDLFYDKSFVAMQFTGLTDKNGKEIYEWDIVKSTENRKYKVVWHQGGFHIMGLTKSNNVVCYPLNLGILDNKEVIGNIYENPELLKDK